MLVLDLELLIGVDITFLSWHDHYSRLVNIWRDIIFLHFYVIGAQLILCDIHPQ